MFRPLGIEYASVGYHVLNGGGGLSQFLLHEQSLRAFS